MSDVWLIFIPRDPAFVPALPGQDAAVESVRRWLPAADEVLTEVSENVQFVHSGGNFAVFCPLCGKIASGSEGWWNGAMNAAGDGRHGFVDLSVTTPCCGHKTSLNDLVYDWPCGFARFTLTVRNPAGTDLERDQFVMLEQLLGCGLRRVYQHG